MRYLLVWLLYGVTVVAQVETPVQKLTDSALNIYKKAPQTALTILEESLERSKANGLIYEEARALNGLGLVYRDLGEFNKAIDFSQKALDTSSDPLVRGSASNNIGVCLRQLGDYEDALTYYLTALEIYEQSGDKAKQATVNNNIGLVYSYLGINDKAIAYHLRAKAVFEALQNQKGISEVYNNIAIIYANDGDLNKALEYFKYSLTLEKELEDQKGIAESLNNVGAVYYYMGEIDLAISYFKQSASREKAVGNYAGVGASYNNIAQVLLENNRLAESKTYIDSAYFYARKYKVAVDVEMALLNYSQFYEATKREKQALAYYKEYSKFKDSLLNIDTNAKIAELEIQFQTEKKEKEILSQKANLVEKELDLSKKNNYIILLTGFAIVSVLLGYLFYSNQRTRNRQLVKDAQLKSALAEIETQNRLQEQRLRISRDLHDNIGSQLTFVISSLDNLKFGKKLPEGIADKLAMIGEFTTATIYELRDTIWAMNKSDITLEDLLVRFSNYIEKANLAASGVEFKLHKEAVADTEIRFSSLVGVNLYRIVQEAFNNALKYANSKVIELTIREDLESLEFEVKDQGKGFEISEVTLGNGLNNMEKRAKDVDAQISIHSEKDKGTVVLLSIAKPA